MSSPGTLHSAVNSGGQLGWNKSTVLLQSGEPPTVTTHSSERDHQNRPWAVGCTCENNHSETPAGISQDAAPQDYLLIAEGVLAVIPREDSCEFI